MLGKRNIKSVPLCRRLARSEAKRPKKRPQVPTSALWLFWEGASPNRSTKSAPTSQAKSLEISTRSRKRCRDSIRALRRLRSRVASLARIRAAPPGRRRALQPRPSRAKLSEQTKRSRTPIGARTRHGRALSRGAAIDESIRPQCTRAGRRAGESQVCQ